MGEEKKARKSGLSWEQPSLISATFPDQRWRKYMLNLVVPGYKQYIPYYAHYLCSAWNRTHGKEEQVKALQIVFMMHRIYHPFQIGSTTKFILWNERCTGQKEKHDART